MRSRLLTGAYWVVPSLVCLALYWPGLLAWFHQDDFVWLNLRNQAHGWNELLRALFQPNAIQGSWRPLSERAFFLSFGLMFGSHALPYRIWVFLTQCANLVLVQSITTRLTHRRAAGFCAALLWITNSNLATVMSWTSAYNLVLCGFFLLLAMYFFLRYLDTGVRRDYICTWAVFLTGFLVMESNAVFPLLAASYALFCARKHLRLTVPFFAASAAYTIAHFIWAPNHAPLYKLHVDAAIPRTLWTYWQTTFEPFDLLYLSRSSQIFSHVVMAASTLALLLFTVGQARRRFWLPVVFLIWYLILLGPVILLRDHTEDYYLTLPTMCLAMLAAYALVCAWRQSLIWKALSIALAVGFLVQSLPAARRRANWYYLRSQAQKALVMGVVRAHQLHPGKVILLDGVDDRLFSQFISQRPFLFLRIPVYLAPGSESRIAPHPEWDGVAHYILPAADTRRGLENGDIVVYRVGPGPLRNITNEFVPGAPDPASAPIIVDAGNPISASHLGPEWYALETGIRWMPRAATVHMPGPQTAGQKLYVTAFCPAVLLQKGPLELTVAIDSARLPPVTFTKGDVDTTFPFALPPETVGKPNIDITLQVNHTARFGADHRDLGLAFGRFEIR